MCPKLRTQVLVILQEVNQPADLDVISVNLLAGKHILVFSTASKGSK